MLVFDGAQNVEVQPDQSVLKLQNLEQQETGGDRGPEGGPGAARRLYYQVNPVPDRNARLLYDMVYHRFHVRELPARIKRQQTLPASDIKAKDLVSFPRFTKTAPKVIVEFQDCIVHALDLLDF